MNMDAINIEVAARNGTAKRLVIAYLGESGEHRSTVQTDSADSRRHFFKQLAGKLNVDAYELARKLDQQLVNLADQADAVADADADSGGSGAAKQKRPSQATALVELVMQEGVILFHDADKNSFARFEVDGHYEVARLNSATFKRWMSRLYYEKTGDAPNSQAKSDAAGVLEGRAIYDGPEHPVHVRLAEHEGNIYLDLGNDRWEVVEIDAAGWRVISESPVMFRRPKAMLPLPTPETGGNINELRRFFNTDDEDFVLIVAWLVAALRPGRPYPILELDGEQGSGKSTRAKMLRSLIDPNAADLRSDPKEPRDLMIAASNGHVIALDNLSYMPVWLSDCLCRLATGGGFSTRTLFENEEETIFTAIRPIILTGIEQVASRGDLIDRALLVSLPAIPENERRSEAEVWDEFNAAKPALLGALLTVASSALKKLPATRLQSLPRMADFALWITAAEPALGWKEGDFLNAYTGNRQEADSLSIESSMIGKVLMELLEDASDWEGTATQLLRELEERADLAESKRQPKGWPQNPKALSGAVRRIAPNLRKLGWEFDSWRETDRARTRKVAFRKIKEACVQTDRTVRQDEIPSQPLDADRTQTSLPDADRTQTDAPTLDDRTQADAADATVRTVAGNGERDIGEI
jgi:hypothetical protein